MPSVCVGTPAAPARCAVAGLYEHYPRYASDMAAALRELTGADAKVEMQLAKDGSGLGAALLAAAASSAKSRAQ